MEVIRAIAVFVLAGVLEIGGGYLVWQWAKNGKPGWFGLVGAAMLGLYGWVATWQPTSFGKTYAVYGGIFIVLSFLWAWWFDGFRPDRFDIVGGLIMLMGVAVILYWPRG